MYLYLRWLICCSKVAPGGRRCSKLLAAQKVAQISKSCQKVAEHNLYRPKTATHLSGQTRTKISATVVYMGNGTKRYFLRYFLQGEQGFPYKGTNEHLKMETITLNTVIEYQ